MKKLSMLYTGLAIAATISSAQAQMRIEISGVGSNQIPVAVASFVNERVSPQKISEIIKADLERSGAFKIIDAGVVNDLNNIDYSGWKAKGADALVIGTVDALADGRYDVRYKLLDTVKQEKISNLDKAVTAQFVRLSAHLIADDVFFKLTGVRGAFSTRISYVKEEGRNYHLMVADADGENEQLALRSNEPIISPSWSPDGTKLAYVSFEQKNQWSTCRICSLVRAPWWQTRKATTRRPLGHRAATSWRWRCRKTATRRSIPLTPTATDYAASQTALTSTPNRNGLRTARAFTSPVTVAVVRKYTA